MKYIFLILTALATFSSLSGFAGPVDTLVVNQSFVSSEANSHTTYFQTDTDIQPDSSWQIFSKRPDLVHKLDKINFGPINGFFWMALTVTNSSVMNRNLFFEIQQPHIYQIDFHHIENNKAVHLYQTGIHFNFYQRPVPNRYFDFPMAMEPGASFTILVRIHHINSLSVPLFVFTEQSLQQNNYRLNMQWGAWVGFLSFSILSAFIAFLFLRRSIFIWYLLYIISAALYGITDQGYAFQYLFPSQADMDAPAIIHLAIYAYIFLIKLTQGLLETKKHLPTVHKVLNGLFAFTIVFIVAGYLIPNVMFRYSTIVLPVLNLDTMAGLILLAYCGLKSLHTNRIIAIFYLSAYGALILASVFGILTYGVGLTQYFGPNPILFAFIFEAVLLSTALVILFRQIQKDRMELAVQIADQQKEMYQRVIQGIEDERNRIAGELHDDIGSRLSVLQQQLSSGAEEPRHIVTQLGHVIDNVRQLSHDLAPPQTHFAGIVSLIEKLVSDSRQATGINIRFQQYDFKDVLNPEQTRSLYRIIQEALNNIIRHSGASQVDIQLFGHPEEVNISIEDDGKGFDAGTSAGLGLSQMKIRAESLSGRIEINSAPGKGTHILLQVPLTRHRPQ